MLTRSHHRDCTGNLRALERPCEWPGGLTNQVTNSGKVGMFLSKTAPFKDVPPEAPFQCRPGLIRRREYSQDDTI